MAIHGGLFDDGARMDRFDRLFDNRYFDAYDAWRRDRSGPRCWREAFGLLDDADTIIVQHLILGVYSHINLDLAIAAARTSLGEAIHALRRNFLLISDILAGVVLSVQDSIGDLSPLMSLLEQVGARTDERILDFSVRQSREEAWYNTVCSPARTKRSVRPPSSGSTSGPPCSRSWQRDRAASSVRPCS
jgi:hypothetical protein